MPPGQLCLLLATTDATDEGDTPLKPIEDIDWRQKAAVLNSLTRPVAARCAHVAAGQILLRVVPICHGGMGSPFGVCCRRPWVWQGNRSAVGTFASAEAVCVYYVIFVI